MGVYHFNSFFSKFFSRSIYKVNKCISENGHSSDNLIIDCNGMFHAGCQITYKYGAYKPTNANIIIKDNKYTQRKAYQAICDDIEKILMVVNPSKRLILMVDGVAPFAKIVQQRSRRYKSALEREENVWDSNNLTPGTLFMDHLSKYIDWFIRCRLSDNPLWQDIEIVYSSSGIPGEGEHKAMTYLRKYGIKSESYTLLGADSDLVMLGLLTELPNFHIIKEDVFDYKNNYILTDIGSVRKELIELMRWEPKDERKFNEDWVINDFVFLMFLVGNDFLPHIPSLEIIGGGVETIINACKEVGINRGHMTMVHSGNLIFSKPALKNFLEIIASLEKELLEQKYKNRKKFFPDKIADNCVSYQKDKYVIDIEKYRADYCFEHFGLDDEELKVVCHEYLKGMQWVLSYYKNGVKSWKWFFPYYHAPPASILINYIDSFEPPRFMIGAPFLPFQQLLAVLPPKSANLLPSPLNDVLLKRMSKYYPDNVEIDLSGKKNEFQGIVMLPFIEPKNINKIYLENSDIIDKRDMKRNIFAKSFIYKHNPLITKEFLSYYGNINNCKVEVKVIEI